MSARPSDAAKPVATDSSSGLSNPASIPHHNLKRRSAEEHDYGDYFDEEYLHVRRCYEDVSITRRKRDTVILIVFFWKRKASRVHGFMCVLILHSHPHSGRCQRTVPTMFEGDEISDRVSDVLQ